MQTNQYIFCYNPNAPNTLVMLEQPEIIASLFLTPPAETIGVWISPNNQQIIKNTKQKLGVPIIFKSTIQEFQSHIKQKRINSNCQFILICSEQNECKAERIISQYEQAKHVIYFPAQDEAKSFSTELFHKTIKQFRYISDRNQLFKIIPQYFTNQKRKQCKHKQLPNFIILDTEIDVSNSLVKSMIAMLNQNIDSQIRGQIVNNFQKLINCLQQKNDDFKTNKGQFAQFLLLLRKGLSKKQAIKWYTRDFPIYKILNNILRSSRMPTEIFYIQPFFKDLFESVKEQYDNYISQKKNLSFTCYRGGMMNQKQVQHFRQNIGGVVQNLGFLSTTLSQVIAVQFSINVRFKINVNLQNLDTNLTYGFAQISKFSLYSQQQVLFNPLNSFKMIQVELFNNKISQHYLITLEYGVLAKNNLHKDEDLTKQESLWKALSKIQKQHQKQILLQGHAFSTSQNHKGQLQYWLKFHILLQQNINKYSDSLQNYNQKLENSYKLAMVANQIGSIYQNQGQYESALTFYQRAKKYYLRNYHYKSYQYSMVLNNIGSVLSELNYPQKSLKYFQESLRIKKFIGVQNSISFASTLNNIGIIWKKTQNYSKSIKYLEQSQQIKIKLYGKMHPVYAVTIMNIASIYLYLKQYKKTLKLLKESKQILVKLTGTKNIDYASCIYKIGRVYEKNSKYKKCLKYFQQSLNIMVSIFGEQSPLSFHNCYFRIANAYQKIGNIELALQYFSKFKQIVIKKQGKNNKNYTYTNRKIKQLSKYNKLCLSLNKNGTKQINFQYLYDALNKQKLQDSSLIYILNEILKINCLKILGRYEEAQYIYQNLIGKIEKFATDVRLQFFDYI